MYIKRFVKHYYIMLIPALLWLFFFSIVPMFGIVMAFQDYNPGQGILHSKFVGLENFKYMFQMNDVKQVLCNTVVIAVGKIIEDEKDYKAVPADFTAIRELFSECSRDCSYWGGDDKVVIFDI